MNNCIYTIAVGNNVFYNKCIQTIKEYAKRINTKLIICKDLDSINNEYPFLNKLKLADLLKNYDRILYLDADILIHPDAPNIFDTYTDTQYFYAFNEGELLPRINSVMKMCKIFDFQYRKWGRKKGNLIYFNTGVMLMSKIHRKIFQAFDLELFLKEEELFDFYEQSYLNYLIQSNNISYHCIDYRFNHMRCVNWDNKSKSYIIHYAGFDSYRAWKEFRKDYHSFESRNDKID